MENKTGKVDYSKIVPLILIVGGGRVPDYICLHIFIGESIFEIKKSFILALSRPDGCFQSTILVLIQRD